MKTILQAINEAKSSTCWCVVNKDKKDNIVVQAVCKNQAEAEQVKSDLEEFIEKSEGVIKYEIVQSNYYPDAKSLPGAQY